MESPGKKLPLDNELSEEYSAGMTSRLDTLAYGLSKGMIQREDLALAIEYIDLSWQIEQGITDMTLHNDTVMRFRDVQRRLLSDYL